MRALTINDPNTQSIILQSGIVSRGLIGLYDAGWKTSYPGYGSNFADMTLRRNALLINSPTFTASQQGYITFNGSNQYAQISNSVASIGTNPHSFNIWFNTSLANGGVMIGNYTTANFPGIKLTAATTIYFGSNNGSGNVTAPYALNDSAWHNIVGIWKSVTSIDCYVDGQFVANTTTAGGAWTLNSIGRRFAGNYFNGKISTISIYNVVLSSSEVLQNYNAVKGRFY